MQVDILAIGSLGDVQPYVALGMGLQRAGYQVRLVTLNGFEELVRGHGLEHLSIGSSTAEIFKTAEGMKWAQQRGTPIGFLRGFLRVAGSQIEEQAAAYWKARKNIGLLIVSPMASLGGVHLAERLGVPLIQANWGPPVVPTRYDWDGRTSLKAVMRATGMACKDATFRLLVWSLLLRHINAARSRVLGLPELPITAPFRGKVRKPGLLLGGYSPAVVPRLPDWGDWIRVTGYWFLDDFHKWTPPGELVHFLSSGPPPVFVGFGSNPFPNPQATAEMVVRALEGAGQRGIVVSGGSGLPEGQLTPNVLSLSAVPHGWLFSRVAVAVHHGGAGVTGAALRAGLPSVVVPVFADQPFWAERVFRLGAGPRPIPAGRLTEQNLTAAIQATSDPAMRHRAATLGEQIRAEDGVRMAVEAIEEHIKYASSGAQKVVG
ncbi:MAG: glycosyltransferase family 1 protein [Bryobacterales bacterium]|nr:glycosyltransferase family 1 protein [Bryobacterales bacterium]